MQKQSNNRVHPQLSHRDTGSRDMRGTSQEQNLFRRFPILSKVIRGLLYQVLSQRREECNNTPFFLQIVILKFYQQD